MTATALLIRHAHTDDTGCRLSGRTPGVSLNALGRAQADALGRALAHSSLAAIYSSPLERAMETTRALAQYQPVPVRVMDELTEIDFGSWTGKTFHELECLPEWQLFNRARSTARIPGGERATHVQERIVRTLTALAVAHANSTFAVVSHGDVLRYAVLQYAAMSLDLYTRIEISPASVTVVSLSVEGPRVVSVNNRY